MRKVVAVKTTLEHAGDLTKASVNTAQNADSIIDVPTVAQKTMVTKIALEGEAVGQAVHLTHQRKIRKNKN